MTSRQIRPRVDPGARHERPRALDEARVLELAHRHVDRDERALLPRAGRLEAGAGARSLSEHPVADRDDQTRRLGQGDEGLRDERALLGVIPAQERLERVELAALQVDDRLVGEPQLLVLERSRQLAGGLAIADRPRAHELARELAVGQSPDVRAAALEPPGRGFAQELERSLDARAPIGPRSAPVPCHSFALRFPAGVRPRGRAYADWRASISTSRSSASLNAR